MQKERGMSAGFLSSKGKAFANELVNQRKLTDEKHKNLLDFIKNTTDVNELYLGYLKNGIEELQKLSTTRKNADESINSTPLTGQTVNYYTNTIDVLLGGSLIQLN
ncbi:MULTISPECIES: nitrate- and nitrite sensing domain-containing protein [unclassified Campylobacter]|uniref:nitrate- and nitrite sensing domain-containing protein n=1 Tax=unclassified Campylobacter TaxID=2593542 RepID=UPI001237A238|nr:MULTISPECIES: nitrate- and nitrite sensing domain-containing protein [unclassified Campylobacter]KAA6225887.1 hypothetical protein FMM54_05555 [Campylobacter sp. LR185c]KAA6227011.1 hypothetical protein FMM55_03410 [Campylobacter sp. LR196d]KAA6227582.1 hypothetical protein FMM57_03955 [Campylobacter sp. LR286c]KAA6230692.1 hypothetical protein FMM58_04585 [Campylobacter sp. LR291e]KAA8605009.1 hypothetical protein CGP82_01075 [Campylobacter sp. LR185c]